LEKRSVVRRERIIGTAIGIAALASVFLLPFSSAISVLPGSQDTLYNIFHFFVENLGSVPNLANTMLELIAYLYVLGTILLLAAGVAGSFPLLSGSLGIAGIVMLTVSGVVSPQYTPPPVTYGLGFYLLWALSLAQLVVLLVAKRMAPSAEFPKQGTNGSPASQAISNGSWSHDASRKPSPGHEEKSEVPASHCLSQGPL
jgi:hypothetical protein